MDASETTRTGWIDGETSLYALIDGRRPSPSTVADLDNRLSPERAMVFDGNEWRQVRDWLHVDGGDGGLAVDLRSGERIRCSRDAMLMLADGSFRSAGGLRPGDVLGRSAPAGPSDGDAGVPDDVLWMAGFCIPRCSFEFDGMRIRLNADETRLIPRIRSFCEFFAPPDEHGDLLRPDGDDVVCRSLPRLLGYMCGMAEGFRHCRCGLLSWILPDSQLAVFADGLLSAVASNGALLIRDRLETDLRAIAMRLGSSVELHPDDRPGCAGMMVGRWINEKDMSLQEVVSIKHDDGRHAGRRAVVSEDPSGKFLLASGAVVSCADPNRR